MKVDKTSWSKKDYVDIIEYMKDISDEKYRNFQKNLIPGVTNMLGVRVPKLRVLAKGIALGNYPEFLDLLKEDYFEEAMLHGLILGYIDEDYEKMLELIEDFLPKIDNWEVCDAFCTNFKGVKENREDFLEFLKKCIKTGDTYYIRFAVVMLKVMYLDEEHIDTVLNIIDGIVTEEYYVRMAIAWTLSDCYIKFEDRTMEYFKQNKLDKFTYNKALQKITESYRVDREKKELIRKMKRK